MLARYENASLPVKPAFGVYAKLPLASSTSVPLDGPISRTAVIGPPPLLMSLDSTPGADTLNGVSKGVEYASFTAVGSPLTVIETVAALLTSFALLAR